jgi:hypothetical protein
MSIAYRKEVIEYQHRNKLFAVAEANPLKAKAIFLNNLGKLVHDGALWTGLPAERNYLKENIPKYKR